MVHSHTLGMVALTETGDPSSRDILTLSNMVYGMCDKTYTRFILSVVLSGAILLVKSENFRSVLNMHLTVQNCEDYVESLY